MPVLIDGPRIREVDKSEIFANYIPPLVVGLPMKGNISLKNVVDLHVHCDPSLFERRFDGFELAVEAAEAGMDGVVMKCHHFPTIFTVPYVNQLLKTTEGVAGTAAGEEPDFEVMGSAVMNYSLGGFNPFMVQSAIDFGADVLWAPTIDARNHGEKGDGLGAYLGRDELGPEYEKAEGLYAFDQDGELTPEVRQCLEKIAEHDVAFAVGHLTFDETYAMIDYLDDLGHDRIILDHPNLYVTQFNRDQQHKLVELGATVNFQFVSVSPKFHYQSAADIVDNITDLGIRNCLITSDMGQVANPTCPEALRIFGELLLEEGLTQDEFETLAVHNPKEIVGLS